ncbi:hypothetical protein U9M48_033235 [Paspalum notatum var. saurae]|uniref:Uncharacterized protein n=1 Tax=Paspalum notatum var. saurae TaxID=547442 RepID=A0AAQ3U7T6_PASNO
MYSAGATYITPASSAPGGGGYTYPAPASSGSQAGYAMIPTCLPAPVSVPQPCARPNPRTHCTSVPAGEGGRARGGMPALGRGLPRAGLGAESPHPAPNFCFLCLFSLLVAEWRKAGMEEEEGKG